MQVDDLYTKGHVRTYCGRSFNLEAPQHTDVFVMDIAVALARECRFNNATKKMYSVAEHSVWCALKCLDKYPNRRRLAFMALLHDAHEYIWKDIPSPMKAILPKYKNYQMLTQMAINTRYNIFYSREDILLLNAIDKEALEYEWTDKVLTHTGMLMDEESRVQYFLHHFNLLCHVPYALMP